MSKGQSAIEYLTTYGWMILAVAAVSGIAYNSIQSSCTRSFSDFYTDAIEVDDFGLSGNGDFLMSVENTGYSEIQFDSINISVNEEYVDKDLDLNLSSGSSDQITLSGFTSTQSCNTLDVQMKFDRGGLTGQEVTGIIRSPIDIQ
jgi:hypothetical protein